MIQDKQDKDREKIKKLKLAGTLLTLTLLAIIMAQSVLASPFTDLMGRAGGGIGGFFENYASSTGPSFLDLLIFAVIFFAVCWVGFNAVFKDAKNANLALSAALSLALSVALVYGGKFTLKKLLPFAGIILFLIAFVAIYALLKKFLFTKDTMMSKILTVVVAIIITGALLLFVWNAICENNKCEQSNIMQNVFGSGSIFGKAFYSLDKAFTGTPIPKAPAPPTKGTPAAQGPVCGDGKRDKSEVCDPTAETIGCEAPWLGLNEVCKDNCKLCAAPTYGEAAVNSWTSLLISAALALIVLLVIVKRKQFKENVSKAYRRAPLLGADRRNARKLKKHLSGIETEEKSMIDTFRRLCENVSNERNNFNEFRRLVNTITANIKETIGGEIDFVKSAKTEKGETITHYVKELSTSNESERQLILGDEGIVDNIKKQIEKLHLIPDELRDELNTLENLHEHFDEHDALLQTFKQHNFREKNVITNIIHRLDDNKKNFEEMAKRTETMTSILTHIHNETESIVGADRVDYHTILGHIRSVREDAIKLNRVFSEKINLLHYLVQRLNELKGFVSELHDQERANIGTFLEASKESVTNGHLDRAIYFASHVIESAEALENSELAKGSKEALTTMSAEARKILEENIPKLFDSMKDVLQKELMDGEYDKVMKLIEDVGTVRTSEKISKEFRPQTKEHVKEYEDKMEKLEELCNKLKQERELQESIIHELEEHQRSEEKEEEKEDADEEDNG